MSPIFRRVSRNCWESKQQNPDIGMPKPERSPQAEWQERGRLRPRVYFEQRGTRGPRRPMPLGFDSGAPDSVVPVNALPWRRDSSRDPKLNLKLARRSRALRYCRASPDESKSSWHWTKAPLHQRPARRGYFGFFTSSGGFFLSAFITSSIARSSCGSPPLAISEGSSITAISGSTPWPSMIHSPFVL